MLKGNSKEVHDENVRELRGNGLSERDAILVSLKRSKKEKKREAKAMTSPSMGEDYPYGTRLELDDDTLEKLGCDELPEVGDEFELHCVAKVRSVSDNSSDYGDGESRHRSMSLQITKMSKLE